MRLDQPQWIKAHWGAPARVQAAHSLRSGGVSVAPFASLNVGAHVDDQRIAVMENRRRLREALALPVEPLWLNQVHGTVVLDADTDAAAAATATDVARRGLVPEADAAVTRQVGRVLAIMVADCLAVLLASDDGQVIAAAHAGWRGLAAGVLEAAVSAMQVRPQNVYAWLGPAIGAAHFEVGDEVRAAFVTRAADELAAAAFTPNARGRWQCDLAMLARQRLNALGVQQVASAQLCTYAQESQCFSFRRDGRTGRMAALIWRTA